MELLIWSQTQLQVQEVLFPHSLSVRKCIFQLFLYQENSYLIGAGITFITYVSLVAAYFVERRRKYASADKKV